MPDWMKGVVLLVVVGAASWYSWNVVLVGSMEEHFAQFEQVTEEVNAAGMEFGDASTAEACLEEIVRRVGGCEGDPMCRTMMSSFVWSCLEAAPPDDAFCATVPTAGDDRGMESWGLKTCARYGRPGDELCAMVVSLTAAFCGTQAAAN